MKNQDYPKLGWRKRNESMTMKDAVDEDWKKDI